MYLSENALTVLKARYLLKDEAGNIIETPEQMFERVARTVSSAEENYSKNSSYWEEKFFNIMTDLRFLPNSPALMNAGKEIGQLAACFVLPVDDSMEGIFNTLKYAALILQSGGGTGFSFSKLRPRADKVRSTGGIASGPVSFMKVYNSATEVIKQGGARRGANMGILRIDHPDILEFIKIKREEKELANFNISVAVTDAFMQALKNNEEYELINPRTKKVSGRIKAKEIFDELIESAWRTGDPGIIFIDRINAANPTPHIGTIESTNPCGEQPLLPYEACVLGSLNISKYVKERKFHKNKLCIIEETNFNWDMLQDDIKTAVRFLDNSIDVNKYPVPEIEQMHKGNRKIGIGVMGWADALILLGIPYDHKSALDFARTIMKFIRDKAREASIELAFQRGSFLNFKGSIYDIQGFPGIRNATTTTIAPTGTLSIIADCSSGIEPLFAIAYKRYALDMEFAEINKYFLEITIKEGLYNETLMEKVKKTGSLKGIKEMPVKIKRLFRIAHEISPEKHIEMQARFQEFTDNAVSKTINMPHKAKKEDVARAFMLAYEKGCKGITIFRYGTAKKGTLMKFVDAD
ncbi:MAG: adenosylcobalamin-dependent ribonucleoside-diphosphate reductase [Nitrospirae bacterium]|nr:adenosylcobalamin-dependent ribonucleoside-diphosphate reductase [Nitrospirota bacterium]